MANYSSIQNDKALYYTRVIQMLFALAILAITGSAASDWSSYGCNTPAKLAFNIACSALTLVALVYFLLSTGPSPNTRKIPWIVFGQLGLDAFLFVLWLAATAASNYDCGGLCSACSPIELGDGYWVLAGSLFCECAYGIVLSQYKARRDLEGRGTSSATASAAKTLERSDKIAAKQGLDAVMIFLFASTLAVTAWRVYQARKATTKSSTHGPATEISNHADNVSTEGTYAGKTGTSANQPAVSEVQ